MQDRLRSEALGPADVVMSWQSRFRPIAARLAGSPTQAQIDAGTCFQGADGGWWIILAEDVAVTGPARPRLDQVGSKGRLTFPGGAGRCRCHTGWRNRPRRERCGGLTQLVTINSCVPVGHGCLAVEASRRKDRVATPGNREEHRPPSERSSWPCSARISGNVRQRCACSAGTEELTVIDRNRWRRRERATLAHRHERGELARDYGREVN